MEFTIVAPLEVLECLPPIDDRFLVLVFVTVVLSIVDPMHLDFLLRGVR
jgi:hypothetical protein